MKVALIQMPHFYGEGFSRPPGSYPLGLGYISSVLNSKGITNEGVNLWQMQLPAAAAAGLDLSSYDVLGISAYSTQYKYLKEFTLALKKRYPAKPIVCGGPGPTFSYAQILGNTGVDVCVIGEGEETFLELLSKGADAEGVAGTAFVRDGAVVLNPPREYIKDLDRLPLPNRDLFDLESVIAAAGAGRRSADMIAGRGCPYNCNYCSKTFSGCRLRSVSAIVEEIRSLRDERRIAHIQFNDELVVLGKPRILELCAAISGLGVKWSCQGRIDRVDEEILRAMKGAGCEAIGYGIESVTQRILDAMNKGQRAQDAVRVVEMTRKAGITPIVQYMFGYPGEDAGSVKATEEFFKAIDHPFIGFSVTPIPGSALYADCVRKGLIKDEEDYLLRLDSGYNVSGMTMNLTGLGDAEFMALKNRLRWRVTNNYYRRRPAQYASFLAGKLLQRLKARAAALFRR